MEWALFNDEGMLAAYGSQAKAEEAAIREKLEDPHAYAGPICPDHEEQCQWYCEECDAEDADEVDEDDDTQ